MKSLFALVLLILVTTVLPAQSILMQVLSSSGGVQSPSSVSASWTAGESFIGFNSNDQLEISNGIQQGWNEVTTVLPESHSNFAIMVYPNPLINRLYLRINTVLTDRCFQFQLTNAEGKILQNGRLPEKTAEFDFTIYPSGVYFLMVFNENDDVKTFKIIKHTDYEEN